MSHRRTLLIVDDKPNMLRLLTKVLASVGTIRTASTGEQAIAALAEGAVDLVLCDLKMPGADGLDVLRTTRAAHPEAAFVLMTAHATVDTAVEALRLGATDYLTKPFDPDEAREVVVRALGGVRATPARATDLPGLVGESPAMARLGELITQIAPSQATALLLGETGTGKERVARALHQLSPRSDRRFVAVNVAAIPSDLLESELFGHARGAFTGAHRDRPGLFEEASGGTLFLDEIGEMRPALQARLTRALEERAVRRIGESRERPVDVRVIAATHRDLPALVRSGAFREDLWYRLNVAAIALPPLREREGDVAVLAHHFLAEHADGGRTLARRFSKPALRALERYDWPGNVRQLRAAVERACLVAREPDIAVGDLPAELHPGADAPAWATHPWTQAMVLAREEAARRYLEAALSRADGDVSAAAEHAGIERESFYRLMRKHGVQAANFRP